MTKKFRPTITIRMGATHSDVTIKGDTTPEASITDLSKATTKDLWDIGRGIAVGLGLRGPRASIKSNTREPEPLITTNLKPRRTAKPNGKSHPKQGKARPHQDPDLSRHANADAKVQPPADGDGAKGRGRKPRKPRPVPATRS